MRVLWIMLWHSVCPCNPHGMVMSPCSCLSQGAMANSICCQPCCSGYVGFVCKYLLTANDVQLTISPGVCASYCPSCCPQTKPVNAADPVDLYVDYETNSPTTKSGSSITPTVGDKVKMTFNVGVKGLGSGVASSVKLRALLPGFDFISMIEESGETGGLP